MATIPLALALIAFLILHVRGAGARETPAADPARLRRHVEALTSPPLTPRDHEHPDGLERAAAYIEAALREHTAEVWDQRFGAGGKTYRNVIAGFGPASSDRIVVGAHYDTAGPLPGADDNASGVAGLIELARLFAANAPERRVELVAFALEEPPFFGSTEMGSAVHAASVAAEGGRVRLMISLEMIGYFTDAPRSQRFPAPGLGLFYPRTGNFIAVVGKLGQGATVKRVRSSMRAATSLPVESIAAPRVLPGVDLSDHRNYWDRGWHAVMVTDTANYRNPNYHTANDTPDTLDWRRMAQVVTGVYAAVRDMARP